MAVGGRNWEGFLGFGMLGLETDQHPDVGRENLILARGKV